MGSHAGSSSGDLLSTFKDFMRVKRGLDTELDLIRDYRRLQEGRYPQPASVLDCLRILDLPTEAQQAANIAEVTTLSPTELFRKAVEKRHELTDPELELLENRLWPKVMPDERIILEPKWLKELRTELYQPYLGEALKKAELEHSWRETQRSLERRRQESLQEMENAKPWIRQLYSEIGNTETAWGYLVFLSPDIANDCNLQLYKGQFELVLEVAMGKMCTGEVLGRQFLPWWVEWPDTTKKSSVVGSLEHEESRHDLHPGRNTPDGETDHDRSIREAREEEERDERDLRAVIGPLRQHFRTIRANGTTQDERDETRLFEDLLSNVFLVMPRPLLRMFDERESYDCMWVWAVDPDFNEDEALLGFKDREPRYQGYLRVRLPQIVNTFFELRRYRAEEYPMEVLWEKAQQSSNQAFVSLHEGYFHNIGQVESPVGLGPEDGS